jgi:hypothetical protein
MPQATILALGTSGATSTDVVVASGSFAVIGSFTAAGVSYPQGGEVDVTVVTPGSEALVVTLSEDNRTVRLAGPSTYRATRKPCGTPIGVYSET